MSAEKRKLANHMDGLSTGKAVDAVELRSHFSVTSISRVDSTINWRDITLASRSAGASSLLNAGQAVILARNVTLCARVRCGTRSDRWIGLRVGDLVMANGLLLQLWAPLHLWDSSSQLRQSSDMEAMFDIMATETKIPDGDVDLPAKVGGAELELDDVTFRYAKVATRSRVCH